ncbi:MAG: dehypoxanthine futalosine cyclase [Bacteroidetes bacterium HGW-Bacteroidetes-21]|jgi:cyclic dehypoxanthinyl futalosine synthase|nr:MAG: dehypoxanthine futalosine cyclase [Bacteroidetes bacterium HGW-Bacteroidetes-21]
MEIEVIAEKAIRGQRLSKEEGLFLYENAPLTLLMETANQIRYHKHPDKIVTWQIDRNINITNVCMVQCSFCNFCTVSGKGDAYITDIDEYSKKIEELIEAGGDQVLLQGGLNPDLGLVYYCALFRRLKILYPDIKLHALGPPEIVFLAKKENMTPEGVLDMLLSHGMDSLPGAGAEILCDRVRNILSPAKCNADDWLNVMQIAHRKGVLTSATMMFGHIETPAERIEHLDRIRQLQDKVNGNGPGFLAFIPWPVQLEETRLNKKFSLTAATETSYLRMIAISRIMLDNISNIQASWLTAGVEIARICLHAGANDMGSIMMEEKVVSAAGANHKLNAEEMQKVITDAGFMPKRRNQAYEILG